MALNSCEAVNEYVDDLESQESRQYRRTPRPHRKTAQRFLKRPRKAALGMKGRNRSRTTENTLHRKGQVAVT